MTTLFAEGQGSPVPLYLTTAGSGSGFTDPNKDRQDSMKDLTEALAKKKNIRLVATKDEAVIVVEVAARGVREDSGSYSKMFGGKNEVKAVQVRLMVGEFATELTGESAGGGFGGGPGRGAWKKAAYKVADQIEKVDRGEPSTALQGRLTWDVGTPGRPLAQGRSRGVSRGQVNAACSPQESDGGPLTRNTMLGLISTG